MSALQHTEYRLTRSFGVPFASIADGNRSVQVFDDGQG
jgi:hypothetical protein